MAYSYDAFLSVGRRENRNAVFRDSVLTKRKRLGVGLLALLTVFALACGGGSPTPLPGGTATPAPTPDLPATVAAEVEAALAARATPEPVPTPTPQSPAAQATATPAPPTPDPTQPPPSSNLPVTVAALQLVPASASLEEGKTRQLQSVLQSGSGSQLTGRPVSWSSSNSAVALISPTGLITGTSAGVTSITATVEGVGAMAAIEVRHGPVVSVEIALSAGAQLVAALRDAAGHLLQDRSVTWSSSDPGVLQVNPGSGTLTASSLGGATITATSQGISASVDIQVNNEPVAVMTVAPEIVSLEVGEDIQLSAAPQDAAGQLLSGRTVTWSTSDPGVAQVSSTGVVTGVSAGVATITANSEGAEATATVTVSPVSVLLVALSPDSATIEEGTATQLSAAVRDADNQTLTGRAVIWSSSNDGVARVSGDGLVTGVSAGNAAITATVDGVVGTSAIKVGHGAVASVEIGLGAGSRLVAALRDGAGHQLEDRAVAWSSSDPTIVGVDAQTGQLTVGSAGVATVKATVEGVTAAANITVNPEPIAAVSVTPDPASVEVGASVQLAAAPKDGGGNLLTGRTVIWTSASPAVATVSQTGLVTGVSEGKAFVTATVEGVKWTASVTVAPQPVLAYRLLLSGSANRSTPAPLEGATVSGDIYVFTGPDQDVSGVSFYLDDPNRQNNPSHSEGAAPYDLAGTRSNSNANGYDTAQLGSGGHTVTAEIMLIDGRTVVVTAAFSVAAPATPPPVLRTYSLLWSAAPNRDGAASLEGATLSGNVYVFTDPDQGVDRVRFYLDDPNRQNNPTHTENAAPYDLAGTGGNDLANPYDTSDLDTGDHTLTAQISLTDGSTVLIDAGFSVAFTQTFPTPATSIDVTPSSASVGVGSFALLTAVVRDADGNPLDRPVVWSSSARSVVAFPSASSPGTFYGSVVPFGDRNREVKATGLSPGSATVTASYGAVSGSAPITVSLAFSAISTGWWHTCGVTPLGDAYCWGKGRSGALGNGSKEDASVPVLVAGGLNFESVSTGSSRTCGITTEGDVYCWGSNGWGGLGDGSSANSRSTPVQVSGGRTYTAVSSGSLHTCALDTADKAFCWGYGGDLALGNNDSSFRNTPTPVSGGLKFKSISAGPYHTCAVTTGGEAYCWGEGINGRLGNGSKDRQSTPTLVSGGHSFTSVSAGANHSCGITTGGPTYCWGAAAGRLGDGLDVPSTIPVLVSGGLTFESVSAANGYTCAITTEGAPYCWGRGRALGNGTGDSQFTPGPVSGGHTFIALDANLNHVCAITTGGVAYCWGRSDDHQLGNGSEDDQFEPAPVISGPAFWAVSVSPFHSCALNSQGQAYCWGDGRDGRLGNGSLDDQPTPVRVSGNLTFSSVSTGSSHTCGVTTEGVIYCWGDGRKGKLGNGSFEDRLTPVQAANGLRFKSVSAAGFHTCAITMGDAAYCWGTADDGLLGNELEGDQNTPVPVSGGLSYIRISAALSHTCALTDEEVMYCWGDGARGKLGYGSTDSQTKPVQVSGDLDFYLLSAASSHTCGVTTYDEAYCWGSGDLGRLGTGSTTGQLTPAPVSGGLEFKSVDAGGQYTCGVTTERVAYCWGWNTNGNLGIGSLDDPMEPVPVAGGLTFQSVSLGSQHTCGVTTYGELYCWGLGGGGRLGNGSTENQLTPVPVAINQ